MNPLAVPSKLLIGSSLLGCALCLLVLPAQALTVNDIPNPRLHSGGWVADSAHILKTETEAQLNQMITELEAKNGAEVAVVTVPETKPAASPKVFATELFNTWHIGKRGQDNGVLLLISTGDRRVEIETGYGVEAILPDAKVGSIIQQKITPRFKQGDFDGGTLAGTKAVVMVLEGQEPGGAGISPINWLPIVSVPLGVFVLLTGVLRMKGLQRSTGRLIRKLLHQAIPLEPEGQSRTSSWNRWLERSDVLHCKDCGQLLKPVPPSVVADHLTPVQKAAADLGSVQFTGWQCPHCGSDKMHLRAYESISNRFSKCPNCQELTVCKQASRTVQEPSFFSPGLMVTTYQCQCCDYQDEVESEISPMQGAGGTSGGSGGGGGNFGGGSSGGGGAGGNW